MLVRVRSIPIKSLGTFLTTRYFVPESESDVEILWIELTTEIFSDCYFQL